MTGLVTTEPDWADIEAAYRAGIDPLRTIAARHPGTNHVAIARKAKKEGWTRDLSAKIKSRTDDLVTRDAVTTPVTRLDAVTEKQIVDANAELGANVIRAERRDITRYRGLVGKLFAELEASTDSIEMMEQIGELMASPDEAGIDKLNDLYRKIISLPGRVDMAKKLVETMEKLINAERRVFNIKDDEPPEKAPTVVEVRLVALASASVVCGQ